MGEKGEWGTLLEASYWTTGANLVPVGILFTVHSMVDDTQLMGLNHMSTKLVLLQYIVIVIYFLLTAKCYTYI